jgi:hypothetical protein
MMLPQDISNEAEKKAGPGPLHTAAALSFIKGHRPSLQSSQLSGLFQRRKRVYDVFGIKCGCG